ncbi:GNAT family N-acetyltransferase [Actinomadura sp. SCN-SB]|uniref:GNAT family N-acetyltransferase n=1 Tax=Actinomadura sp. SCN-SB TaxID=3373092 RepID=UPI0037512CEA
MTLPDPTFDRHGPASAEKILKSVIVPLYEASHADVIGNPFYSSERFAERVRGYCKAPGFEIVIAYIDGEPVGQAFGYALPSTSKWWDGLTTPVPEGFTTETGTRTFAFNELMVVPHWQGKGIAHALHDELLAGRSEERATLLVREDNTSAQNAYRRWGWSKVGKLRPYQDAPHFDSMILSLPLTGPTWDQRESQ